MVYYREKNIKGHNYWYLQESYREGNKVKTRTLAYIGKVKPTMGAERYYGGTNKVELGTTTIKTKVGSLPKGMTYQLDIIEGIHNPYHFKVFHNGNQIYEDKVVTQEEVIKALKQQKRYVQKMNELGTTPQLTQTKLKETYLQVRKEEPRFSALIPIHSVKRELKKQGYTNEEEINQLLLDLERKRIVDLQVAYSETPKGGFWTRYPNGKINYDRGYVYSVRWRDQEQVTS